MMSQIANHCIEGECGFLADRATDVVTMTADQANRSEHVQVNDQMVLTLRQKILVSRYRATVQTQWL